MSKFNNLFSNVSHIKIGENVDEETIKAVASAAKSVENGPQLYWFQKEGMKKVNGLSIPHFTEY